MPANAAGRCCFLCGLSVLSLCSLCPLCDLSVISLCISVLSLCGLPVPSLCSLCASGPLKKISHSLLAVSGLPPPGARRRTTSPASSPAHGIEEHMELESVSTRSPSRRAARGLDLT